MTAQPRGDGLMTHEFGILMPGPTQGHDEDRGLEGIQLRENSIHRGITAAVAVIARERGMDGGALNAGAMPLADLLSPGFQCG